MLPKILRFAVDSVLYYCVPMNRRAFTLRPSVVIIIIITITTITAITTITLKDAKTCAAAEERAPDSAS